MITVRDILIERLLKMGADGCLWHSYQQHPTSEKCGRWLKHRAWMKQSGGCRK